MSMQCDVQFRCAVLCLIIYLLNLISLSHTTKNVLKKHVLFDPGAVCNDGSNAIYYIQHNPNYTKWIIFLEGGGGCSTIAECKARNETKPYFMSSKFYPEIIEGRNLFNDAYFDDHNKVLLVYCSSDFWLGSQESVPSDKISESVKPILENNGVSTTQKYDSSTTQKPNNEITENNISNTVFNETENTLNDFISTTQNSIHITYDQDSFSSPTAIPSKQDFSLMATPSKQILATATPEFVTPEPNFSVGKIQLDEGSTGKKHFDNISSHQPRDKQTFRFNGVNIFKSAVNDLMSYGLNLSSVILLAGSSAGGIGAINHANYLKNKTNGVVSVLVDSSWFLNYNNDFKNLVSSPIMETNGCRDISMGFPCCLSISCSISKELVYSDIQIMALSSSFDILSVFSSGKYNVSLEFSEAISEFQQHSGQLKNSLNSVKAYKSVSYLITSCMQHVYLATSDLWINVYKSLIEENFQGISLKHLVDSKHFQQTQIHGQTLNELFLTWYTEATNKNVFTRNHSLPIRLIDSCKQVQCDPSCPEILFPIRYQEKTPEWQRTLLVTVILTIIILAYCFKLSWIYNNWKLKQTQSAHLTENKRRSKKENEISTCLPPCPQYSCIGISCSKLVYNISSNNTPQMEKNRRNHNGIKIQKTLTKLRRKSSPGQWRKIIKGVSAYFNPGQLAAIMGPSGSGKTTLLDVLTSRKNFKETEKHIFINGLPAEETREWFVKNSGYVLQLATPYHEELTVRQNLTYSAMLRLPSKMKLKEKMSRVEQVLGQTGLYHVADVVVGGNTSKSNGLSGGQKRRLCVGLQLVDLPSVIFLDEPTSGLDSASSLELLEMLHGLTLSGRLVVVTIHQPRIEIFHMFDTILFLCDGQAAYFGSPLMAPTMIAEALQGSGKIADSSNPADTIMDVLNNTELQSIIVDHYNHSGEIEAINRAISRAKRHPQKTLSMKFQKQTSSISDRLIALDGRCSSSQTLAQKLYFPIIFMLFSLALGTCYFKTKKGILLMSCYMVFLCASQLFMSSVIHAHLSKAFALFSLEKADGIGFSHELVLHAFVRIFSQSSVSLICACIVIHLCALQVYDIEKFILTSIIHLQLNQVWIALIICIACMTPNYSHLLTPIASAVAGFAGGFLVPEPQMPIYYYWLFYINPTHWAYGSTMFVVMNDLTFECKHKTILECQDSTGAMVLKGFGFQEIKPYRSMLVLLAMLVTLLVMSALVLEVTHAKKKWKKVLVNSMKSIKLSCISYYQSFQDHLNENKKLKEAERQRLFDLAEQKYTYKSPLKTDNVSCVDSSKENMLTENNIKKEAASGEDVLEESDDSSNDEDNYELVTQNHLEVQKESKSRLNGSFTTFLSKLQNLSRSGNSSEDKIEMKVKVNFRRKSSKNNRDRRKTFSDVISAQNTEQKQNLRHASISSEPLIFQSNSPKESELDRKNILNDDLPKVSSLKEAFNQNSLLLPQSENDPDPILHDPENSFQKTLQLISHGSILPGKEKNTTDNIYPPDIVIDIETNLEAERPPIAKTEEKSHFIPIVKTEENKNSLVTAKTEEKKRVKPRKKKRDPRSESKSVDTWSKYLDTTSRQHEVYCALSSVKRRLKNSKKASDNIERESIVAKEKILERTPSYAKRDGTLQRKASLLILREKQMSMRSQLHEFQQQLSHDGNISPATEKQNQLFTTQNKYRRLNITYDNKNPEEMSPETIKNSRREIIERLSLLSSGRSSNVTSVSESKRSTYDGARTSYSADTNTDKDTNPSMYEDNVYEDQEDSNRRPYSFYSNESKCRENDPLLPDERALVEGLLNKYAHLETAVRDRTSSQQDSPLVPSRLTFSSGVKIKGLSPNHSRKTSRVERNSSSSFNRSEPNSEASTMSKLEEEDDETRQQVVKTNNNDVTNDNEDLNDDTVFQNNVSEKTQHRSLNVPTSTTSGMNTPLSNRKHLLTLPVKPPVQNETARKISITVTSVARPVKTNEAFESSYNRSSSEYDDEDSNCQTESAKLSELQQEEMLRLYKKENYFKDRNEKTRKKKNRESIIPETDYDSGSTSSEYEENVLKTVEGFIIPDDTINKMIASSSSASTKLGKRRGSQSRQDEIERLFKKDNYLKDRSRGIKMPIGSTGKVNQLLSKFENNKNTKTNLTSTKTRRSLEKLNEKSATGKQRTFFKVLKTPKTTYSSSSSSDEEMKENSRNSFKQRRSRKISDHLENINE